MSNFIFTVENIDKQLFDGSISFDIKLSASKEKIYNIFCKHLAMGIPGFVLMFCGHYIANDKQRICFYNNKESKGYKFTWMSESGIMRDMPEYTSVEEMLEYVKRVIHFEWTDLYAARFYEQLMVIK